MALASGQSVIKYSALLTFDVAGKKAGGTVLLKNPGKVSVKGAAVSGLFRKTGNSKVIMIGSPSWGGYREGIKKLERCIQDLSQQKQAVADC